MRAAKRPASEWRRSRTDARSSHVSPLSCIGQCRRPGERPTGWDQVRGCDPSGARGNPGPTPLGRPPVHRGRGGDQQHKEHGEQIKQETRRPHRRDAVRGHRQHRPAGDRRAGAGRGDQATPFRKSPVRSTEQEIARALSASLRDPQWREQVRAAALGTEDVDLQVLAGRTAAPEGKNLFASVSAADRRIAGLKGLPASTGSLLRVRLGAPSMRSHLNAEATPGSPSPRPTTPPRPSRRTTVRATPTPSTPRASPTARCTSWTSTSPRLTGPA